MARKGCLMNVRRAALATCALAVVWGSAAGPYHKAPPIRVVRTVYIRQTQTDLYRRWRSCEVGMARIYMESRAEHYKR